MVMIYKPAQLVPYTKSVQQSSSNWTLSTDYIRTQMRCDHPGRESRVRPPDPRFSPTSRRLQRGMMCENGTVTYVYRYRDGIPLKTTVRKLDNWYVWPNIVAATAPPNHGILAEIKNQKVNLAMFCAEYRQSGALFVDSAKRLYDIYRDVRKGRLKKIFAEGSSKGVANNWLAYRYGVVPLVMDMQGTLDTLANVDTTFVHKVRKSFYDARTYPNGSSPWPAPYNGRQIITRSDSFAFRAWVEYESSTLKTMSSIGLTNPAELVWELIPFSFVVDWFISVGDSLAGLDALTGTKRVSITSTYRHKSLTTWPTGGFATHEWLFRGPVSSLPTLPRFEPSVTLNRVLDSLSLLRSIKKD